MPDTIYEQYPTARWEVKGKNLTFPVDDIEEGRSNRLAKHRRLYRDGARLDDTYAEARTWKITSVFFNDKSGIGQEPGIEEGQYPDNVNQLCDSFDIHETGDLTLPTRGSRRCRAESYTRFETKTERDACKCTFVWVEDNEDDASAAQFVAPSAKSVLSAIAVETFDACTDIGAISPDLSSLSELANDLIALAEAPGNYVSDLEAQAKAMTSQLAAIEEAFTVAADEAVTEAESLLTDPESSLAGRRIRELSDTVATLHLEVAAQGGISGDQQQVLSRTYQRWLSIYDVATIEGQEAEPLMSLNSSIPDMLSIPPGTVVLIYGSAA